MIATIKWRFFKTRLSSPNHSLLDKPVLLPSAISIYLLSYFLNHQVCFVVVDKFLKKARNVFANTSSEPLRLQAKAYVLSRQSKRPTILLRTRQVATTLQNM